MYCLKGKWRVNRKACSPEFSPVYSWVASALSEAFFTRGGICFCIVGTAELHLSSLLYTHQQLNSYPCPKPSVFLRSSWPLPAHQFYWVRWRDKTEDTLPLLLLWQSLITAGKTCSEHETALHYVPDCFGSWPSPDLWVDRPSPIVHWPNYLTGLKQLG